MTRAFSNQFMTDFGLLEIGLGVLAGLTGMFLWKFYNDTKLRKVALDLLKLGQSIEELRDNPSIEKVIALELLFNDLMVDLHRLLRFKLD